jgi:Nuclease-related domain
VPVELAGPEVAGPVAAEPEVSAAEAVSAEAVSTGAGVGEAAADEPESADLPLWDWSPPGDTAPPDDAADEPAAQQADPPRVEWKLVVTPVEEVKGAAETQPPGIGQTRGNLAHLARHPRMRVWRWRIVVAVLILVALGILVSWQFGLTLAVIAVIADTIYRSRRASGGAGKARMTGAQRRTRRQLAKLGRAGYRAMNGNLIPDSEEQIDHLVVGPAGVFAIDSEAWDKHLIVRTRNARQLWHGPFSMKDRLEHARWESERAADLLSGEMGEPVAVRPAMAVYGPKIPWDVATIREVDVFSGPRLRKYLRRRARNADVRTLSNDEIERIYAAASKAFPHLSSGSVAS